ncbi:hypothetical protein CC86DRAFT_377417 [Ophiobolus disseminans]|uniref:Uncharacterized protein n=1 Tax=Ophiobolus disseminans TaxID=1469910 RepID=A0A6A7AGF9_9PLEO|nr:hypothetical protein CC86DRAFT_377417 [Ophiobolus disseminans]
MDMVDNGIEIPSIDPKQPDTRVQDNEDIVWARPQGRNSGARETILTRLSPLHGAYPEKNIWFVDVEGIVVTTTGFVAIPYQIGIVNLEDPSRRLNALIKYPGFPILRSLAEGIVKSRAATTKGRPIQTLLSYLRTVYKNDSYQGLTMDEIQSKPASIGFDETTALVVNWGDKRCDHYSPGRILRGQSQ